MVAAGAAVASHPYVRVRLLEDKADQKNSLVSGPPTDPATTPPTVNFLQHYGEKKLMLYKLIC